MLKHNYHAHTIYCRHAVNTPEEVIQIAIEKGLETIGISEHVLPSSRKGSYRLASINEETKFINEMIKLKQKYNKQIKVLCGFECELIDPYSHEDMVDYCISLKQKPGVDYILIGHHNYRNGDHAFADKVSDELFSDWLNVLEKAMQTNEFLYVVHPDGFMDGYKGKWNKKTEEMSHKVIDLAIKYDHVLGINLNGIRYSKFYPYPEFWKIAGKKGAKAIIEVDSHDVEVWEETHYLKAIKMAKEANVELVEKLDV